jgi:hypothetical protein
MTAMTDFTHQEWDLLRGGPTSAGILVMTAQPRGAIREVFSMGKAYADARQQHGQSELLDEIVTSRPEIDRTPYSSTQELREHCLTNVRDVAALLEAKASPEERYEYKRFVLTLADKVARAYGEGSPGDDAISSAERSTIDAIARALGAGGA